MSSVTKTNQKHKYNQMTDPEKLQFIINIIENNNIFSSITSIAKEIGISPKSINNKHRNSLFKRNPQYQVIIENAMINKIKNMPEELFIKNIHNNSTLSPKLKRESDQRLFEIILKTIKQFKVIPTLNSIAIAVGVSSATIYKKNQKCGILYLNPDWLNIYNETIEDKIKSLTNQQFINSINHTTTISDKHKMIVDQRLFEILLKIIKNYYKIPSLFSICKTINIAFGTIKSTTLNLGLLLKYPIRRVKIISAQIDKINKLPEKIFLDSISLKGKLDKKILKAIDVRLFRIIVRTIREFDDVPSINKIAIKLKISRALIYATNDNKPFGILGRNPEFIHQFKQEIKKKGNLTNFDYLINHKNIYCETFEPFPLITETQNHISLNDLIINKKTKPKLELFAELYNIHFEPNDSNITVSNYYTINSLTNKPTTYETEFENNIINAIDKGILSASLGIFIVYFNIQHQMQHNYLNNQTELSHKLNTASRKFYLNLINKLKIKINDECKTKSLKVIKGYWADFDRCFRFMFVKYSNGREGIINNNKTQKQFIELLTLLTEQMLIGNCTHTKIIDTHEFKKFPTIEKNKPTPTLQSMYKKNKI